MELDAFNQLEEKVKNLVDNLKHYKNENEKLTLERDQLHLELDRMQKESSVNSEERNQIKQKVATLIELIDSIEKE